MRNLFLALALFLLIPSIAEAQDPQQITVYRLPEYHLCTEGNIQSACFNINQFQDLLQMDADLHLDEQLIQQLRASVTHYQDIQVQLQASMDNLQTRLDIYVEDRNRLYQLWTSENARRHQLEERPQVGDWVAWAVAAICGVIAVGLGVTLAVVGATL
jgi:hypothetical protein